MPSLPAVETHHSRENPMKSPSAAYGSTESTPQIISANPSRWSSDGGSASSGDVVEDALIKAGNLLRTSATRSDDAGNAGPDLQARPGGSTSFSFSVFNLMNAIMGSGLLGLSFCAKAAGTHLFVILLLCMCAAAFFAIDLLLTLCDNNNVTAYAALGAKAFGRRGFLAATGIICAQNVGAMTSYLLIAGKLTPNVMHNCFSAGGFIEDQGHAMLILITATCVFPLACMRKIGLLGYTSGICIAIMLVFGFKVWWHNQEFPCQKIVQMCMRNEDQRWMPETQRKCQVLQCNVESWRFSMDTFFVLPTMAFSFVCHTTVLPVYTELRDRSKEKMQGVAGCGLSICCFVYLFVALAGYANFTDAVAPDILKSLFEFHPASYSCPIRAGMTVMFYLTVPLLCFPLRKNFVDLIMELGWLKNDEDHTRVAPEGEVDAKGGGAVMLPPDRSNDALVERAAGEVKLALHEHVAITGWLILAVLLLAIYVPNIEDVFAVVGATTATSLVFILPGAFFLKLEGDNIPRWKYHLVAAHTVTGAVIGVVALTGIILDWMGFDIRSK